MTHDKLPNNSSDIRTKVPMTHDELLNNLNFVWSIDEPQLDKAEQLRQALRAVVELHKPWTSVEGDNYFWGFRIEYGKQVCPICGLPSYPCSTIQAIEKELK